MQKITKTYADLKAAHAQWRHPGHCRYPHGERWTIHITFAAEQLDDKNFVVDFGGLRGLRDVIDDLFDHTLLLDKDDPERETFEKLVERGRAKVHFLPSASCEGLCKLMFNISNNFIQNLTENRVWVEEVTVEEDPKNTATLTKE